MNALTIATSTESLPALLSRAGQRLLDAQSSGEVLEAKKLAELALHLAKVTTAARETHADCLRIITRAEMRMADEADKAQERGELHPPHRTVQGSDTSTFDDLGLDRRRLAEWREVRDAGEAVVEGAIEDALAEGRAPTKADITRKVRGVGFTGYYEWYTPQAYIQKVRVVLGGIDLDPASNETAQRTVKAKQFFTKESNGLAQDWHGRVFLNPPYGQPLIARFVDKMIGEVKAGRVSKAIMLTNNCTDTAWFQKLMLYAGSICFTSGRIHFEGPEGELSMPVQGQSFFYFGENPGAFFEVFRPLGGIVRVVR
jgi:phage N-6-adenine-methyltransferase